MTNRGWPFAGGLKAGCDGVEPDNVDGYTNRIGFPLKASHQATYHRWLADQAHACGLSIGLKNDLEQVAQLEPHFEWALDQLCFEYNECDLLLPFVQAGKAVFGVEYTGSTASFCPQANSMDFDWLKKTEHLDASRQACRQVCVSPLDRQPLVGLAVKRVCFPDRLAWRPLAAGPKRQVALIAALVPVVAAARDFRAKSARAVFQLRARRCRASPRCSPHVARLQAHAYLPLRITQLE